MKEFNLAVVALDAINGDDPESAHVMADKILLESVPPEVAAAYMRLTERVRWWAFA